MASSQSDFPALGNSGSQATTSSSSTAGAAAPAGVSAAQWLQQQHESKSSSAGVLTEDPFPPGNVPNDPFPPPTFEDPGGPTSSSGHKQHQQEPRKALNVEDEDMFPSLGASTQGSKVGGGLWGAPGSNAAQRLRSSNNTGSADSRPDTPSSDQAAYVPRSTVATDSFQLPTSEIHIQAPAVGSNGAARNRNTFSNDRQTEPTTLSEVLKLLMKRNPNVTVEASTSRQLTTFIIKSKGNSANGEAEVAKVKRDLVARLAKKVTTTVEVPAALRGIIVGAKGRMLKSIQDSTGANVQLPAREDTPEEGAAAAAQDSSDLQDGPRISINISGDSTAVASARQKIQAIVSERISKVQTKLDSIPKEFWPLLSGAKNSRINTLLEENDAVDVVTVFVPRAYEKRGVSASGEEDDDKQADKAVTVSGEREAVARVVHAIEHEVSELKRTTKTASIGVNKRQHRFLIGSNAEEILEMTGCSVEVPMISDPSENVTIRGTQEGIIKAFGIVMDKANATPIDTLDLMSAHAGNHDRKTYAGQITRYILVKGKFRQLAEDNNVNVFLPRQSAIDAGTPLIEVVGKDSSSNMAGARQAIIAVVRKLPPSVFSVVDVDSLVHRHLIGKKGNNIRNFEKKNVEVVFPPEGEDRNDVLLVYTGEGDAQQTLQEVRGEILNMAKDAADIKTETLYVPALLHRHIIGQGGTTLNAVIGEDRLVNVIFGSKGRGSGTDAKANGSSQGLDEDSVIIRGPSEEVKRVKQAIQKIAEDAKNEEIVNSHIIEFDIDAIHVRHVVGKAGAGISKLREDLGVKVDFEEQQPSAAASATKKKGTASGKSRVTIKGRKENAEEARKRIQAQVSRLADEVTLTIPLPPTLERGSLIGKQGAYLKRLEDKYEVRVNFPRDNRKGDDDDEDTSPAGSSEIIIRGPKKGADAAKGELVALIAYEQEHGNTSSFTVSRKALPRILGKAGASINQIRDDSGVQSVDVDQDGDDVAAITLKGTKDSIKKAKLAIQAIAKEVDDEARFTMQIPKEYHTTLIGAGGSSIRDLIAKAGGPTDGRQSGNTVRFPRQGDANDDVVITAPKAVAEKIRAALEQELASLKSRIVYGVAVPQQQHASVIGKGASGIQELQRKHGVKITMPSWKEYSQVGDAENADELKAERAQDIVKIVGPRDAAIACAEELATSRTATPAVSQTVMVPKKHHAKIAQSGRFFRSLPSGTRVSHDGVTPPSNRPKKPAAASNSAARVDDESADGPEAVSFELVSLQDDNEEGDDGEIPWVVQSASQEDAERVVKDIHKALELASSATHCAFVTVPRPMMPRIVGRGGSGLDQLRSHGVEVEVVGKRDANQLTLTGTPSSIDAAHQQILRQAAPRRPRQQRIDDDY
ncbi:hypothetical protein OIO90_003603 [Microbotryomycetes sp. JL221]|nr:hypothetical protein OIO90_003603 [Microbotryomycetes sp. JL221]